jgi:hypothetical protein
MASASPLVQYIVVRKDLAWPAGALIAQACHAATSVMHMFYDHSDTKEYLADLDNMHKIVLQVPFCFKHNRITCVGHLCFETNKKGCSLLRTDGQGPILKAYPFRGTCDSVGPSAVHLRRRVALSF